MARRLSDTTVEMGESQLLFALIDSPDSMIHRPCGRRSTARREYIDYFVMVRISLTKQKLVIGMN